MKRSDILSAPYAQHVGVLTDYSEDDTEAFTTSNVPQCEILNTCSEAQHLGVLGDNTEEDKGLGRHKHRG